jgi:hypothetical protein
MIFKGPVDECMKVTLPRAGFGSCNELFENPDALTSAEWALWRVSAHNSPRCANDPSDQHTDARWKSCKECRTIHQSRSSWTPIGERADRTSTQVGLRVVRYAKKLAHALIEVSCHYIAVSQCPCAYHKVHNPTLATSNPSICQFLANSRTHAMRNLLD